MSGQDIAVALAPALHAIEKIPRVEGSVLAAGRFSRLDDRFLGGTVAALRYAIERRARGDQRVCDALRHDFTTSLVQVHGPLRSPQLYLGALQISGRTVGVVLRECHERGTIEFPENFERV